MVKGRFAPSPTGRMHLGNIATALLSWLSARSKGGTWLLRIEDLDTQRSRLEYARQVEDDLRWLGLDWDEGGLDDKGPSAPYLQSQRTEIYNHYLSILAREGYIYPCSCTRADIMAANAPHQSDGRVIYSGRCRPHDLPHPIEILPEKGALRIAVPDGDVKFDDLICGPQSFNLARDCGDFILRRADGGIAYQLAVVVDDALMGVTEVVRGNDLLLSAAQQIFLFGELDFIPPRYGHTPLLCNESGKRLSKRDASLSMEAMRRRYTPQQLIGRLAHLLGLISDDQPMTTVELLKTIDGNNLKSLPSTVVCAEP